MSQKINALTKPQIINHGKLNHDKSVKAIIETKSTAEVDCCVMVAIVEEGGCMYRVNVAVQYASSDAWYKKDGAVCLDIREALKRAYGLSRKNYHVTASRAFAGLLHDSIVPATEDIDC